MSNIKKKMKTDTQNKWVVTRRERAGWVVVKGSRGGKIGEGN